MKNANAPPISRFKSLEPETAIYGTKIFTSDSLYWKSLEFPTTVKEYGAVSHIDIQPCPPYNIAVSAATRVQIYSQQSNDRIKTFSRFHNTVYSASFRSDGNLIVAGNEDGQVRLFDTDGRVPLRIFKGHNGPVHVSKFCNDLTSIFSAADDKTMRVWDVATEKATCKFSEHEDYVRTGATSKSNSDILATGSYDHCVRMYDRRTKSSVLSINHGFPVESILLYPSGTILLSAGGNTIKVWDLLQGGKLLSSFSNHHKTITCLAFNHDCSRLLSGSLDRHVKIYDVKNYSVVHNIDYPAPILSMAVSHHDKSLVVGMADKMLSIRHRKAKETDGSTKETESANMSKRARRNYYMHGKDYVANKDDVVIHDLPVQHLSKYDRFFQKFQHSKALDAALSPHVKPEVTVAVLKELFRRGKLHTAVAGKSSKKLLELLKFLVRNITKISFSKTLLDVTDILSDIYSAEISEHPEAVKSWFIKLRDIVKSEAELHRQMFSIMGCMDALLASHSISVTASTVADPGS